MPNFSTLIDVNNPLNGLHVGLLQLLDKVLLSSALDATTRDKIARLRLHLDTAMIGL